jgi:hypothetical protein
VANNWDWLHRLQVADTGSEAVRAGHRLQGADTGSEAVREGHEILQNGC